MKPCVFALALASFHNGVNGNMNGKAGQYKISNGNPLSGKSFSTDYTAEFFDVYSPPIKTRYSEVFWTGLPTVPLPSEIVQRFSNKTMAVVGFEADQVIRTASGDVPVPIHWAYNHHFVAFLLNTRAVEMKKVHGSHSKLHGLGHGAGEVTVPVIKDSFIAADSGEIEIPLTDVFNQANGGEFRMSYHGFPKGYGQLIQGVNGFQITPMQIDTKNRDHPGPDFVAGPLPRASTAPPNASYSGLLECPCSTRLKKEWLNSYAFQDSGFCQEPVLTSSECFQATGEMLTGEVFTQREVSDSNKPPACSVMLHADGSADSYFNTAISGRECGSGRSLKAVFASASSHVNLTVALDKDEAPEASKITISGPADSWFGVGFGTDSMCLRRESDECPAGGTYAIIVTGGGDQNVTERKLGFHGPGRQLATSLIVKSNTVQHNVRTVVLARPLKGLSDQHYTFDPTLTSLPFINAKGCSLTFAQHCGHAPSVLNFVALDEPTCICQNGVQGSIGGNKFPYPSPCRDLLLEQHNPACYVQSYTGGLQCCRHLTSLLDAEQAIPWADDYLEYQLKFRFYFEEYVPASSLRAASHQEVVRIWMDTERDMGEHDVPQCLPGTAPSQCIFELTGRWEVKDMMSNCSIRHGAGFPCTGVGSTDPSKTAGVKLIHIAPHCHASSCISMELYHADTGLLLCHADALLGKGSGEANDEKDYLAMPPCLFGDPASEGLPEPILLPLDAKLLAVIRHNNTQRHMGQMGHWQMRGVVIPINSPGPLDEARRFEVPTPEPEQESLEATARRENGRGLTDALHV